MKTVCQQDMCTGCMACISICKKNAITICDSMDTYNAIIDLNKCVDCGACMRVCQSNNSVEFFHKPIEWYQGWSNEESVRKKASSGGAATEIMRGFVKAGGIVCSCTYKNGIFGFEFADELDEIDKFVGSKYVKSNPNGIYEKVKTYLKENKKILFVGLPCQVAAIKKYIGEDLCENLYTIDLICHGTPSPKVLNLFLLQYDKTLKDQKSFKFRDKDMFQIAVSGKYLVQKGASDCYSLAFLNALTYTENCYSCNYAQLDRVSDITLGDSWGSNLPVAEQKRGISLILLQTEKGKFLLNQSDLHLEQVGLENAVRANHQLEYPSKKCKNSEKFWECLKSGKCFNLLIVQNFPKKWVRQEIKKILLKFKIIHR